MHLFIKKCVLFMVPLVFFVVLPFFVFYKSGEFISLETIKRAYLNNENVLIGKVLPYFDGSFSRMDIMKEKKAAVLALGNSRVLAFQCSFFKECTFFNAGGFTSLGGYTSLMEQLGEEARPKLIILGLEQSYFHPITEHEELPDLASEDEDEKKLFKTFLAWRAFYTRLATRAYTVSDIFSRYDDSVKRIGAQAFIHNAGVRSDGSYSYGTSAGVTNTYASDYQFKDTLNRIQDGNNLMYHGNTISQKAFNELAEFLYYAQQHDIYVIGFLPPYAQKIYDIIKKLDDYKYIFKLEDTLQPLFKKYSFALFNFMDMSSFGAEPDEVEDGLHASEKAYLRLFTIMVQNNKQLAGYAQPAANLQTMLEAYP